MTDGLTGMTLEQINEALKNSFTGIKRDMDFLRKSIVSQEERFNETLKSIKNDLAQAKKQDKDDMLAGFEDLSTRVDALDEKMKADLEFLNESVAVLPGQKDTNDNSILKAFIEKQIDDLQRQINNIKKNSAKTITEEKDHDDMIEIKSIMKVALDKLSELDERQSTIEKRPTENKTALDKIGRIHEMIKDISGEVDKVRQTIDTQRNTNSEQDLLIARKDIAEQLEKVSAETEVQLSKHSMVENKNFELIKGQIMSMAKEIESLKGATTDLAQLKKTSAPLNQLKEAEKKIALILSEAARKNDLLPLESKIDETRSAAESMIADEIGKIRSIESQAAAAFTDRIEELEDSIKEIAMVANEIQNEFAVTRKEMKKDFDHQIEKGLIALKDKITLLSEDPVTRNDVEGMMSKMSESMDSAIESFRNAAESMKTKTEETISGMALDMTTLTTNLNSLNNELSNLKLDADTLRETTLRSSHFEEAKAKIEMSMKDLTDRTKKSISNLNDDLQKTANLLMTKKDMEDHSKKTGNDIKRIFKSIEKITLSLEQTENFKSEQKETIIKITKEIQRNIDRNKGNLSSHQKILEKVAKQLRDIRIDVDKNHESARKLNTLIKRFGQLREISLERPIVDVPENKKLISSTIKDVKDLFRKKRKPEVLTEEPATYKPWIAEQKEEKKEVIDIRKNKKKDKEKSIGVIAKIGLEQGIITEKDL
ncbi:hypothetical protein COV93_04450 [Candidatus Woesearchaeota archaeon CG11_big_fil_rev_8_21_14_0_20_43_8]|nr:MAG: hypothetical protein COV93_04450 [Candidatus Woesearchaeota archaeon CG11_big_fil_rev_8_21_14_0_20_43_8]